MKFGNESVHFSAMFLSISIIVGLIITLNYILKNKVSKDLLNINKNQMAQ